jgi:NAD(P)H-hydrate epimerase
MLPADAHKGQAGRVLCICGSPAMPGAATLVVRAAQRAGAGLVTLVVFQRELIAAVSPCSPETLFLDVSRTQDLFAGRLPREIQEHRHDVRVVGPGLSRSGRTRELVRRIVEDEFAGPLVLDADALNVFHGAPELILQAHGTAVVTPHVREAERLLDREVPADADARLDAAREIAERTGALCVLKGRGTVVTDGERVYVNDTGNSGMATAGSGDVLCGVIGAYLAASILAEDYAPFDAVAAAVHAHGAAGDLALVERGARGIIASDLIEHLPAAQRATERA